MDIEPTTSPVAVGEVVVATVRTPCPSDLFLLLVGALSDVLEKRGIRTYGRGGDNGDFEITIMRSDLTKLTNEPQGNTD